MTKISEFINLSDREATSQLMKCCTSDVWVERMLNFRPFKDKQHLLEIADSAWLDLQESDYLQAFEGHPRIGDVDSLREKYEDTKEIASGEQRSVSDASDKVIIELSKNNEQYFKKFGFIFIVCATGKSAAEMLAILCARLPNDRRKELGNAAEEQRKIFQIRLIKLFEERK